MYHSSKTNKAPSPPPLFLLLCQKIIFSHKNLPLYIFSGEYILCTLKGFHMLIKGAPETPDGFEI
jgi:hypothetical protein